MWSTLANSHPQSFSLPFRLRPHVFPPRGFEVIDPTRRVEEEALDFYEQEDYYPMNIGSIVQLRFQIMAKIGYGASSTVWLARDFHKGQYSALKVHVSGVKHSMELQVDWYLHFRAAQKNGQGDPGAAPRPEAAWRLSRPDTEEHPGRRHIRKLRDAFAVRGPNREHVVLVMVPMGMSLGALQASQPGGVLDQVLATQSLTQVALGLAYLHEAGVVHTDLHSDNLLFSLKNDAPLRAIEENEWARPSARKTIPSNGSTVYVSHDIPGGISPLQICDFGQAHIGKSHTGIVMPSACRAPEVILGMTWASPVDMWSIGYLAWDLVEPRSLFRVYDAGSVELNNAHHLAAMTALLGPPPLAFRKQSAASDKYWEENGEWKGPVPMPPKQSLESRVTTLTGDAKARFVDFVGSLLCWVPEYRLDAMQAYFHPWLRDTEIPVCSDSVAGQAKTSKRWTA